MSRRPPEDRWAVISFHKQGLTTAAIRRTTGFDRGFITRCLSKYNDSGSVDDAERAGRPRTLSKGVERAVEKKMRGKRHRSSRVIERELKRQKIADVSYKTVQTTMHPRFACHLNSGKPRDCLKLTSAVGCSSLRPT